MIESGLLQLNPSGTKNVLTIVLIFEAQSPVSYLFLGRASIGYINWADEKGIKLDKYHSSKIDPI